MTDLSPGPSDIAAVAMDLLEFAREHASPRLPLPYLWHVEPVQVEGKVATVRIVLCTWYGDPGRAKSWNSAMEIPRERITNAIDCGVGNDVLLRQLKAMVEAMMLTLIKLGDRV